MMFTYLRQLTETDDSKILFILAVICGAMILDFASGTLAAWVNPDIEFKSKMGINGIIRKIASIVLLVFFIPISVVVPGVIGVATLYTLYLGYLAMEMRSIFENYKKFGFETGPLQAVLDLLKPKDGNNQL
jgi:toxin secretion/phage lysis holin